MRRSAPVSLLALTSLLVAGGCVGVANPEAPATLADARALAAARGVPVLIDFYTDW